LSSISTASCLQVVQVLGCWECPCCVGLQSANGTVRTSFSNSHYYQISLKIVTVRFVVIYSYLILYFDLAVTCQCQYNFCQTLLQISSWSTFIFFSVFWVGGGVGWGGGGKVSELVYMCVAYSHRKNKGIGCSLHDEKVVWCTYDWMAWYSSLVISIFLN
jgi:hypothetical protein